ncbi:hypothetical protein BJF85_16930 [Saccharomonospora sp. CUA-673]|uniref:hypothetical protein n=1 Tax=Saccharomonospora sp. CUA-673 TaxID=1904969 RepID=UPI000963A315|nr:hypothetical protein [Saccharomonospora sp. CUA-673]OLT46519.1 hypothetical protein BJF85_16930 [Saccharomonospora sp. CUA-673]
MADSDANGGQAADAGAIGSIFNAEFVVGRSLGPPGGEMGRFRLDPDEAPSIHRALVQLAENMQSDYQLAQRLCDAQPPAQDPASLSFTKAAVQSWEISVDQAEARWQLYRGLAERVGKAIGEYQAADEQAGRDVNDAGGDQGDTDKGFA